MIHLEIIFSINLLVYKMSQKSFKSISILQNLFKKAVLKVFEVILFVQINDFILFAMSYNSSPCMKSNK